MANETVFDKILSHEIPANRVYEDDDVLAFHDINPQAPVHVLVIPKRKITSFAEFAEKDASEIGNYVKKVAQVARQLGLDDDGYRVIFNHGRDGQQTVAYVHAHILGGRSMKWPPG